jgi:hypothetical protein
MKNLSSRRRQSNQAGCSAAISRLAIKASLIRIHHLRIPLHLQA